MRLIDADEFNKQEVLEKLRTAEFDDEIKDAVEKIPTAYDVDKVLEQLKNNADYSTGEDGTVIDEYVYLTKAVEIVKSGGIG